MTLDPIPGGSLIEPRHSHRAVMAFETRISGCFACKPWSVVALLFSVMASTVWLPAKAETCGSDAKSPIATDRPQITNSSIVVPCGSLQFENGFQVTGYPAQPGLDLPETSVRFGAAGKTELRLTAPDYFYKANTASGFSNGFGDLSLGFKRQLGPAAGFGISLIPSVSLPAGASLITSRGYDPTVQLPWSRSVTRKWTAAGQFALEWPTVSAKRNLTGQSSVYLDRQLTSFWDAYVEYSGAFPQRGGPQHLIDFGAAYKPSLHQQLDVHLGFGLSSAAFDYSIGFGYSVRFQTVRSK